MKRMIIDMDDVIADATGQFINYYEREFGIRVDRNSLNHQEEGMGFPGNYEIIKQFPYREQFFQTMTPNEGSQLVIEELNRRYDLFIVSAAMEFPQSLPEKLSWLKEHFPFLSWKQIVFCGSKTVVHGDYMIDDLYYNLDGFNGEKYLFTAPHNLHIDRFNRVNNWNEVATRFL
ncbi:5'(3')-deoxyribonucleotidase [Chryseolinea sp. T2]|uniref:5' nucleotidase, NT5C type n=1 Tax=Chryseolinea sp. T2 TaxID=3129255 RepID=UPI0030781542